MNTDAHPTVPAPSANGSAGHGHPEPAVPPDGAAAVMLRFQEVMARFLDTQRSVMLSYLGTGGAAAPSVNGQAAYPLSGSANGHPMPAIPVAARATCAACRPTSMP